MPISVAWLGYDHGARLTPVERDDGAWESVDEAEWQLLKVAGHLYSSLYCFEGRPGEVAAQLSAAGTELARVLEPAGVVPKNLVGVCLFILDLLDGRGLQPPVEEIHPDGTVTTTEARPGAKVDAAICEALADSWRSTLKDLFGTVSITG